MESSYFRAVFISTLSGLSFAEIVIQPEECPGMYCGRKELGPGRYSECGACPRGYQPQHNSVCSECTGNPMAYDWLYLGFMALVSLMLHFFSIDYTNKRKNVNSSRPLLVLHLSALAESVIAVMLTLLLSEPVGSLHVRSCPVARMEDWYTMLYNPSPNFTTTLYCTQEIVYPLYTIVMVYYAFSLLLLMVIRPIVSLKFVECRGTKSIYAALYFLPILIVLQALFGGILYYTFPYFMIISTLITSAIHMSTRPSQTFRDLVKDSFRPGRSLIVLIGHWLLHAYGLVSLTEMTTLSVHIPLLLLVFFPVFFYIGTAKFTDTDNLERIE